MSRLRAGTRALLVLSLALVCVFGAAAPASANQTPTELQRVLNVALAQVGDRYSFAAVGPNTFDCSGFVTYAFREAGLIDRIGSKRRSVEGYYRWFANRGLADRLNPKPGDLIVWGRFKHMGIYLGDGMAVSALINPYGVKVHPVTGYIGMRVKAYLHVNLER